MVYPAHTRMTAADYFALPESNELIELLDGEIVVSPTPIPDHQRAVFNFAKLIDDLIPNGEVFIAPLSVYLDDDNVPEPDVPWVEEGGTCKVMGDRLEGPPALIVEVLSPSTARYDKSVKFLLYEKFGVSEYWIADPKTQMTEVWRLEQGKYVLQGVYSATATFTSTVLGGKTVDLSDVF